MPSPTPSKLVETRLEPSSSLLIALGVLQRAHKAAVEANVGPWEFAVRLPVLITAGPTETELRSLLARGLAEHAHEQYRPKARRRSFCRMANLALTERTCLILTPAGERLLQSSGGCTRQKLTPQWDSDRRQLWYGNQLVKWYRVPAGCQEIVLAAFEEDGWSPRIDDPLPRKPGHDPRERLHETVRALNRAQIAQLLVFERDGTGEGVTWAAEIHLSGTVDDTFPQPTAIIFAKPSSPTTV